MQKQQVRVQTQAINQTQSLQAIQTLLRAGLGTIAYLRNLLPEDNFNRCPLTSIEETPSSQPGASQESTSSRTHISGFQITNITRGYTDEADRILNYMEYGIFDALEKRYLRSFIFGIYLDAHNPTNIAEAYTFNFKYHQIPESGVIIPVMSLAEGRTVEDPITKALKNGKVPTLRDVKSSIKTLLKTLIQAISNMDVLPRRRFATFKLFYTDETPAEYEPPHFESGDAERDKWYFMTHDLDEVPERTNIGKIQTGHHSINLNVTSIASYLPSSKEHGDDAAFSGLKGNPEHSVLTPQQEVSFCKHEAEKQYEDAKNRNLVWLAEDSVELSDTEAEAEDDPDYIRLPDGTYEKVGGPTPVGMRNENGGIEELPERTEVHFGGIYENIPQRLQEVVQNNPLAPAVQSTHIALEETQALPNAFTTPLKRIPAPADLFGSGQSDSSLSSVPQTPNDLGFDPEILANMHIDVPETSDTEMLDLETQIPLNGAEGSNGPAASGIRYGLEPRNQNVKEMSTMDEEVNCDCGIKTDDGCCLCEGPCGKWYHIWCIGYHSIDDPRIPQKFICFDCGIRQDDNWDLIKVNWYPQIALGAKDLASFRRAIKIAQSLQNFVSTEFSKLYGTDHYDYDVSFIQEIYIEGNPGQTGQMLNLLQDKDFLLQETIALDDMGVKHATRSKKGKGKEVKSKMRKNVQNRRYVFNKNIVGKREYLDYFEPDDPNLVMRIMGISTEIQKPSGKEATTIEETQTQAETQECTTPTRSTYIGEKRAPSVNMHGSMDSSRPPKRLKMSVAAAVDLAE